MFSFSLSSQCATGGGQTCFLLLFAVCGGRERVDAFQGRQMDFLDDDNDDDYEEGLCTHLYPVNCFAIKYPHGKSLPVFANSNPVFANSNPAEKLFLFCFVFLR